MDNLEIILSDAREECNDVLLTDDYRKRKYKNNFSSHLDKLINTALSLNTDDSFALRDSNFVLKKQYYWEIEGFILESIDDVEDSVFLDELDNIEDQLRGGIIKQLGKFYTNNQETNEVIDYSVEQFILAHKFSAMGSSSRFLNPWESSKKILNENKVLHSFNTDLDYLKDIGIKIKDKNSSEINQYQVGIIAKGKRKDFTGTTIRDLYRLRNYLNKVIQDEAQDSNSPISTSTIISKFRKLGIEEHEIKDNQIKNWLISPLKRSGKIGSCKEGYFSLNTCEDLYVTYKSHLENFKGYMHTLESYRLMAERKKCDNISIGNNKFESHLLEMKKLIDKFEER